MHLERPVIVIVPCFDRIYNFPTTVSRYILDVYTEVYGLDLRNPEDIIFISGHNVPESELETRNRNMRRHEKNAEIEFQPKAVYDLSDSTEHIKRAIDQRKALEKVYKQSVMDYMHIGCISKGIHSPIAPTVHDSVSKNHCLVCSKTFRSEEDRLVWLFDWSDHRSSDPDMEK